MLDVRLKNCEIPLSSSSVREASSSFMPPERVPRTRSMECLSDIAFLRHRVPVLDDMIIKKLEAFGRKPSLFRRQSPDVLLSVSANFQEPPGDQRRAKEIEMSRHLLANLSFPHLLSHMKSYLTPTERMSICAVSKLWNDPISNLTIRRLDAMHNPDLTDAKLHLILAKHKSLRELNIFGCCQLTDISLCKIAAAVPKLRELNISYCLQITDNGIRYLENCTDLERLYTAACNKLSEKGMEHLYSHCERLERPFMPIPRLTRQKAAYGWRPAIEIDDVKDSGGSERTSALSWDKTPPSAGGGRGAECLR